MTQCPECLCKYREQDIHSQDKIRAFAGIKIMFLTVSYSTDINPIQVTL